MMRATNGFWQTEANFHVTEPEETPTPTPTPVPPTTPTATPTPPSNQPPVISLNGDNPQGEVKVTPGCPFVDPVTAHDPEDGNLTDSIKAEGSVNINAPGPYSLTYTVTDSGGLPDTKTRQVTVFGAISTTLACVFERPEGRALTWLLSCMVAVRMLMLFTH
jgi:hypothetical protein